MLCCPFQALPRCSPVVSQAAAEPPQPQLSEREQGRAICGCACSPNQAPPKPRGQDPALHPHQELWSLCRSSGGSWCLGRFCWSPASQLPEPGDLTPATSTLDGAKNPGGSQTLVFLSRQPGQSLGQRLHTGNGTALSALLSQPTLF